jgi:hypothetical protein
VLRLLRYPIEIKSADKILSLIVSFIEEDSADISRMTRQHTVGALSTDTAAVAVVFGGSV